jgi:phage terminase large subunit-like protein
MNKDQYLEKKVEAAKRVQRLLPYKNYDPKNGGVPLYKWQRDFMLSDNRMLLLTAANQVGKSSIQIRKMINLAIEKDHWSDIWPESHHNVAQFWYLYPTLDVATIEVKKKWIPEWLPREEMKDDPYYGWTAEYKEKKIYALHFNSGVTIYFKSYAQKATDLQSGTVHYIGTDEELPIKLYDELKFRTSACSGYFSMAFTATIGQYEWECAMERQGEHDELFPKAHKIQVSLYECLEYVDAKTGQPLRGVKTPWTREKIQDRKESCSSEDEVKKRIYGRFVNSGDMKYSKHVTSENMIESWAFDPSWYVFSAVDPGSGGEKGHPSGIIFIAVKPDYSEGIVFHGWRGDGIQTTAGDTLKKYIELKGNLKVTNQWYDYHSKDFAVLGERENEIFERAEKSHDIGEGILKTLLKYNALKIVVGITYGLEAFGIEAEDGELLKLFHELKGLRADTDKRHAKDDLIDPTRYIAAKVPWDLEAIKQKKIIKKVFKEKTDEDRIRERREMFMGKKELEDEFIQEIEFWNDMM